MEDKDISNLEIVIKSLNPYFEKVWATIEFENLLIGVLYNGYALKLQVRHRDFMEIVNINQMDAWMDEVKAKFLEAYKTRNLNPMEVTEI